MFTVAYVKLLPQPTIWKVCDLSDYIGRSNTPSVLRRMEEDVDQLHATAYQSGIEYVSSLWTAPTCRPMKIP